MKKTTMCLAAALLLISGMAVAQDIHYTVYGVAHVSTDLQNNGDKSEIFVSSNTSRVGIKGTLDTNNDLFQVIFQYESQVDFSGNGAEKAAWANRNSYAGLKGDWGTLIWGRNDTPFKSVGRSIEYFPERIGDARNATTLGDWDLRNTNMIQYTTPVLSEMVKLSGQYVPDQGVEDKALFSGSAVYDQDGIMVGVSLESHGKAWGDAYSEDDDNGTPDDPSDDPQPKTSTGIRAVAKYTDEQFSVAGLFQTISNYEGYDATDVQVIGLGASFLVAPAWELKGQAYMIDPSVKDAEGHEIKDNGANQITLGVDYILNKSTRLYVAYAMMMNEDHANSFAPFAGGHGQSYGLAKRAIPDSDPPILENDYGLTPYGISVGLHVGW